MRPHTRDFKQAEMDFHGCGKEADSEIALKKPADPYASSKAGSGLAGLPCSRKPSSVPTRPCTSKPASRQARQSTALNGTPCHRTSNASKELFRQVGAGPQPNES